MKEKIIHFFVALFVYGLTMFAINYMFKGEWDWQSALIFGVPMSIADVLFLNKWRNRNKK